MALISWCCYCFRKFKWQQSIIYTGVANYCCTNSLRQSIKQTILQKPINYVLFNYLFIPSNETNNIFICFKIKFNLLKTVFILGYPSRYFECLLLLITGVYVNECSRKLYEEKTLHVIGFCSKTISGLQNNSSKGPV